LLSTDAETKLINSKQDWDDSAAAAAAAAVKDEGPTRDDFDGTRFILQRLT